MRQDSSQGPWIWFLTTASFIQ